MGVNPKKTKTLNPKDLCTLIFIPALFATAKVWKKPKCLPWMTGFKKIKNVIHTHTGIVFSYTKEDFAIGDKLVGLWGVILSKIGQRKTNTI